MGLAVKTDEFEVGEDTHSFRRDDEGRIVVPPPPPTSADAAGPIGSAEDLDDDDPLYLKIGTSEEPVVQTVLQESWKELASVAIGMLIILSLVLAVISRNREDEDGAGSRIESIGELQSLRSPATQQAEDEPDLVGAPVDENQSSGTFVTEDDDPFEPGQDSTTPASTAETTVVTSQTTQGTSVTATTASTATTAPTVTSAPPTLPSTTTTIPTTTTTVPPTTNIDPDDVRLANGGFDNTSVQPGTFQIVNNIPGWQSQTGQFEIWHTDFRDVNSQDGDYFLELNANGQGLIYQDVETLPNSRIQWSLQHRGRNGRESVEILLGSPNGQYQSVDTLTSGSGRWRQYSGTYVVPEGQTVTRFIIRSLVPGGSGNFLDEIRIETVDEIAN